MAAFLVVLFCLGCSVVSAQPPVEAKAEKPIEARLPQPGFAEGWRSDGIRTYDKKTLFEYINGEAELYFPYGFEAVATTNYTYQGDSNHALVADVYRMGSGLDAFGIYSNYRYPEAEYLKIGAQGFASEYQLMFYQDRYFVKLSAYGEPEQNRKELLACARAIEKELPPRKSKPVELRHFVQGPKIIPYTERYVAQSLLGYAFFPRGLEAQATLEDQPIRVFTVMTSSSAEAKAALNTYEEYLAKNEGQPQRSEAGGEKTKVPLLWGVDPLHKRIILFQIGSDLLGMAGLSEEPAHLDEMIEATNLIYLAQALGKMVQ